ncbi:MAG: conjugal transfer protein TraG, partial [Bacteroidetes bacterium]
MQNEDDVRSLAKIIELLRAVSILIAIIHIYWFCYEAVQVGNINVGVVDKILLNFQKTTGLFSNPLWTKLICLLFIALSCLGTRGVKAEKITWIRINIFLIAGIVFFFFNGWILKLALPLLSQTSLYIFTIFVGYFFLLKAGLWMSRLLKNNLMKDVFNSENESFMQETQLMENEYSINLSTRFQYKGKLHEGWINVVNPFRASIVLGTPGSGKS